MASDPSQRDFTWRLIAGGAALWCLAIVVAPVFRLGFVYAFFSSICHQLPARSWSLSGSPLPVCIRCAAIYAGFFAGALLSLQPSVARLKFAILATLVEVAIAYLFVDLIWLRAMTGFALGATAAPLVLVGVREMLRVRRVILASV